MRNFFIFLQVLIFLLILPAFVMHISSINHIFSIDSSPEKRIAIVFGASAKNGVPSDVLADRVQTAVELYEKGKVEKILMSGDNSIEHYNEPIVMKKYAISLGVAEEDIVLDYAGFRTYDTCYRAHYIFNIDEAILVSQKSHLKRAIYLCSRFDIVSFGVVADKREYEDWNKQLAREFIAQTLAFYESIFPHEPHFLGEKEEI